MWVVISIIISFLSGVTLGVIFGVNAMKTKETVMSTNVRHTKEFNKALKDINLRLAALPEELVDAVREAFPQLYDGPDE